LHGPGARARPALVEPARDVAHPAGDVVERFLFEGGEVGPEEPRHAFVAHGDLPRAFQEPVERLHGCIGIEQPVLAGRPMKKQRRRIDGRGDVEVGEQHEAVVESITAHALTAQPQPHCVACEGIDRGVGEPGVIGIDVVHERRTSRVGRGARRQHAIEHIGHRRVIGPHPPRRLSRLGRRRAAIEPLEEPTLDIGRGRAAPGGLPFEIPLGIDGANLGPHRPQAAGHRGDDETHERAEEGCHSVHNHTLSPH